MDYLDPLKKKQKRLRIGIGYVLLGIAIALATIVLVYITSGYYVDDETGQIIQNGLIYVDSKPESAEVSLNGELQGDRTESRFVVPAGGYDVELNRDGYRTWQRSLVLDGGSVRRLNYARLIPENIDTSIATITELSSDDSTQSIDKRWILLATSDPRVLYSIDVESNDFATRELRLPTELVPDPADGSWEFIEWADNNRQVLAKYTSTDISFHAIINRDAPSESFNVAEKFPDTEFDSVRLRADKRDLVYLHNSESGILYRGDTDDGQESIEEVLSGVEAFESFGREEILYVRAAGGASELRLVNENNTLILKRIDDVPEDSEWLLAFSKIGPKYVAGVSHTNDSKVTIYYDPYDAEKTNEFIEVPVPTATLRLESPTDLEISTDSSIITARSVDSFVSHEFEEEKSFSFDFEGKLDAKQKFNWVDGRHFTVSSGGKQYLIDYDGSNQYELVSSINALGGYFDKDLDFFFSFEAPTPPEDADDEAEQPKLQMNRSFMRTQADR